jgi:hypothetical protein
MIDTNGNNWAQVVGIAIGSGFVFLGTYVTFKGNINKLDTDKMTTLNKGLDETIILLKKNLEEERKLRGIVEGNWEGMKLAFNLAFDEYESKGMDMGMLKTLRDIINK